jgi:hypothetical protein
VSIAVTKFLTDLRVHFPPRFPRPELEKHWVLSLTQVLRGFSPEVLERACRDIISTRTRTDFPRPAECKKACEEAMRWMDAERRAEGLPGMGEDPLKRDDYTPWRVELANKLIDCSLGKQAAREGWILSLHDYARKHGCLPTTEAEIRACKTGAKEMEEAYGECVRGNPRVPEWDPIQRSQLRSLGENMLKRREELSEMVLNGVVR